MADTRAFSPGDNSLTASRLEQVRLLYGSPGILLLNVVNAIVVATLLWRAYPIAAVAAWLSMFFIFIPARLYLWHQFRSTPQEKLDPQTWFRRYTFGSVATGLLWGMLSSVVFVSTNLVYCVVAVFVVGGMTAGAAMRSSVHLPSFYGFVAAAILPMVFAFLVVGSYGLLELGLLLAAFAAVIIITGRSNNRWITENIGLRHDQSRLNESLQRTTLDLRREIDQREQISTALQESNERFRGIGENAQDAVIITDPNGNVAYWNPAAERIFSYTQDEIVGRSAHDNLTTEHDRKKAIEGYRHFSMTGTGPVLGKTLTLNALRKDKSEFPIELSVSGMQLGGRWHALAIVRDVSERVRAEAALRNRESELREAQRVAHLGNWVWDAATDTTRWSEELYRLFRRDPLLPALQFSEFGAIMSPESFARLNSGNAACRDAGTPFESDAEITRPDGTRAWLLFRGEAERDSAGRVVHVRGTVQDVTDRKKAEQNIAGLHRQMEQSVETLRRHEREMTIVAKLSDILQSCHSRSEAYPIIAETAKKLFQDMSGALAVVSRETGEIETVAQWGAEQVMSPQFRLDDCWALRTGQRHDVDESGAGAPCMHFSAPPKGGYFCLPLAVLGETTGLLHLNASPNARLDDEHHRLALSFGDVVKLSLSNLKLRERLSEQAIRDQLTTLFNRHYLAETLPREIRRAQRDNVPLSVVMIDIDYFKKFNDSHGHAAGDHLLRELGAFLRGTLRAGDIACRYGGEEFVLVLAECDQAHAQAVVQRICMDVKRKSFVFGGERLRSVTLSAGIAELSGDLETPEALLEAADQALYFAKKSGRDRVEIFAGPAVPLPSKSVA